MFKKKGQISVLPQNFIVKMVLMTVALLAIIALIIIIFNDKVPNLFSGAIEWLK